MSPELTGTELYAARNAVAIFEMEIRTHLHEARQLEKKVAAMYDFVGYTHFVKGHRAEGLRTRIGELKAMTAALETELTDLENES